MDATLERMVFYHNDGACQVKQMRYSHAKEDGRGSRQVSITQELAALIYIHISLLHVICVFV